MFGCGRTEEELIEPDVCSPLDSTDCKPTVQIRTDMNSFGVAEILQVSAACKFVKAVSKNAGI